MALLQRRRCCRWRQALVMVACGGWVRALAPSSFVPGSLHQLRLVTPPPRSILAGMAQQRPRRRRLHTSTLVMMPEGPEVRILCDQLQGAVGQRLVDVRFVSGRYVRHDKPGGFAAFAQTMSPVCHDTTVTTTTPSLQSNSVDIITAIRCKGKFLYMLLDNGDPLQQISGGDNNNSNNNSYHGDYLRSMWITLGMTGRFVRQQDVDMAQVRWYWQLQGQDTNQSTCIYYYDVRNFGTLRFSLSKQELLDKLQSLGPNLFELQEQEFEGIVAHAKPDMNVCRFLMDQTKLAGVGNYLLAEGLYRAGIDPYAALREIDAPRVRLLFRALQEVAHASYAAQGLTRKNGGQYRTMDGEPGDYGAELQCYGRPTCARGQPVIQDINGPHGRTIWYTEEQLFMPLQERRHRSQAAGSSSEHPGDANFSSDGSSSSTPPPYHKIPISSDQDEALVQQIFSTLTDSTWRQHLADVMESDGMLQLAAFLATERAEGATVYPPPQDMFAAFNLCPFDNVKVVIVGQDPYHGPNQGHGLAFSVRRGVKPPPSLVNIFREAMHDVGIAEPRHGNLSRWAQQGVLLLNTVLTVRRGAANSHARRGWEQFTDAVIATVNDQRPHVVFLLWGNPATKKAAGVDKMKHTIIKTSHPSPLGATKTVSPFLGSECFSRTNAALVQHGNDPVDWNVDP